MEMLEVYSLLFLKTFTYCNGTKNVKRYVSITSLKDYYYYFYSTSVLVLEVPCERFKWSGAFVSGLHYQS